MAIIYLYRHGETEEIAASENTEETLNRVGDARHDEEPGF